MDTLREVEPTSHMGVPRVWEKFMERIQEAAAQSGFIRRKMLLWAMSVALEQNLTCPGRYGRPGGGGAAGWGHRAGRHPGICWAGVVLGTPVRRPQHTPGRRPSPTSRFWLAGRPPSLWVAFTSWEWRSPPCGLLGDFQTP